jgi:hypothetical protein
MAEDLSSDRDRSTHRACELVAPEPACSRRARAFEGLEAISLIKRQLAAIKCQQNWEPAAEHILLGGWAREGVSLNAVYIRDLRI